MQAMEKKSTHLSPPPLTCACVHVFPKVSEGSEQADQTLPLLNLLLNLIAGGGDLGLRGQNSTQEACQRPSYCCVEGPAERTQGRPEGRGLGAAVADHLL